MSQASVQVGVGSNVDPSFYVREAPADKAGGISLAIRPRGDGIRPHPADPLRAVLDRLAIDPQTFEAACDAAARHGSTAADELIAAGLVDEQTLGRAIADALGVAFESIAPDVTMVRDGRGALQFGDRHLRTCDASLETRFYLAPPLERLGDVSRRLADNPDLRRPVRIATQTDIARTRAAATQEERSNRARLSLAADFNRWSARDVLSPLQAAILVIGMVMLLQAWIWTGSDFWVGVHAICSALAFAFTAFRLNILRTTPRHGASPILRAQNSVITTEPLPIYTVLIALHREAAMAEPLVRAMAEIDWPRSRLEVFFVCEANDPETIAAIENAIAAEPNFSVIATPRTSPTTKPKALNYALPLARGEFVVLYDAEDRPHPQQLRCAYETFRTSDPTLACLQAPLTIRNASSGWLEALFAMEYAVLFRAVLPWLAARSLPLPLGGTSNHFRRAVLVEVGGWDSHNVAEDADLGIRLARLGCTVGTIDCPTSEIATSRWIDWRNQRTRWIKGWLQTWLVHMRDPGLTIRQLGLRSFLSFQIVFGGMIAASLMHVVFAGHLVSALIMLLVYGETSFAFGLLAVADAANILLAYLAFTLLASRVLEPHERPLMTRLWSLWFYWLAVSFAGIRAIAQLIRQPHMWEKTPHREPAETTETTEPVTGG